MQSKRIFSFSLVFLLTLITIINYFDRSAISYAILPVEAELGLNNAQFGLAVGSFGIGYLLITLFAGFILDRFGTVVIWGLSAIGWSLITLLVGYATGLHSLMTFLILLGMGEGFNSPAILRTVYDWLDPKWRARSIAIALLGVPIASLIGGPFISLLIERSGWRAMFAILGLLGIGWALLWFLFFFLKHPAILSRPYKARLPIKNFLLSPPYLANCFNFFSFGCISFFVLMWLPGYLEQTHGIALRKTGYLVMYPWGCSALFQLFGGWLIDSLWKKTGSIPISRVYPLCIGFCLASLSFFGLLFTSSLTGNIVCLSLGLGFTFLTNPCIYTLNADLFPNHPATAQSISTCFFALAGIVSPILTGFFSHKTNSFHEPILFIAILPLLAGSAALYFITIRPNSSENTNTNR